MYMYMYIIFYALLKVSHQYIIFTEEKQKGKP